MRHLLLTALLTMLLAWRAEAQFTPQGFSYQCIVRDDNGASLNNQTVSLLFTIRSGAPNGPVAYSEMQTTSTNEFGLINLFIGQGTPLQGAFANINWGGSAKYLTVSVETAPNVFDELGTTQLMSVPYALYSQNTANSGDGWGTQTVQTSPVLQGGGTAASPLTLAQQGATTGQILKWNGTTWLPQNDEGTVTEINTGAGLTGGPITNSGTISLENTTVTPGLYGSATQIPVITVDEYGRVTEVFTVTPQPSSIGITGAAGINVAQNGLNFTITNTGDTDATDDITNSSQADGDVSGPFANLQIKPNAVNTPELANGAVTAAKLDDMGAVSGQILKWTGTMWAPAADALGVTTIAAGTGINVTGGSNNFTITNTGDTDPSDDLTTVSVANGDISGPFSNLQIKPDVVGVTELASNAVTTVKIAGGAVTGEKIAQMSAANGQVLKWNGTTWAPAPDNLGTVTITGGVGIDVIAAGNNYTIANNGDINPFDDITENSLAGGDLSGTFDNLQIKQSVVTSFELANNAVSTAKISDQAVTGAKIDQMNALNGQVLKWNGATWAPATDNNTGDNWGTQFVITGTTLTGVGTLGGPLNLAQQNATPGQVLKWNGVSWAPGVDNNTGGDNWGTQVVAVDSEFAGNGTPGNPLELATQGATPGQVLKFNGASWAPQNDDWGVQTVATNATLSGTGIPGNALGLAQQAATAGQVLKWNGSSWAPAADNDSGGDDWGAQTAVTNATLTGNGTPGNALGLAQQAATAGQVLKWNGSSWAPAADNDSGGDDWGAQVVAVNSEFEGNGTPGNPLELATQGATPGQVLKFNGASWVPEDDNDSGGDDWGTQTALTDATIKGDGTPGNALGLAEQSAAIGQVLKFDGNTWTPADDNTGTGPADNWGSQVAVTNPTLEGDGTAGNPLSIAQQGASLDQVLKWNGATWAPADEAAPDNWGTQAAITSPELDGDGTGGDPLRLAAQGASAGQVLKFDGSSWLPGNDNNTGDNWGTQVAQTGVTIDGDGTPGDPLRIATQNATAGQILRFTGVFWGVSNETPPDNWGTQVVQTSLEIDGNGTAGDPLSLADNGASVGQVLKFDGTQWLPGDDLGDQNSYAAGTGIDITGTAPNFTIENTGDLDATNELQTLSLTGGDLTLSNGGGTVTLPSANSYTAGTGINITGSAPNFTIENTGDADADPTNELQNLSLNGKILKITGTNSQVDLDTIVTNAGIGLWQGIGIDIHNGNSGNVGIGLDAPLSKLHIKSNQNNLLLEGSEATLGFSKAGGAQDAILAHSASGLFLATLDSSHIVLATGGGKTFTVEGTTGNVGIGGLNSGNARLSVMHDNTSGGLMIEHTSGTFWELRADAGTGGLILFNNTLGPIPAGFFAPNGVYTPSDKRLKKDVNRLASVLDNIMKLEPVHYRYNQESAQDKASLGFIAQEVHALFPELVGASTADDGQQYMALNYAGFGVLAIKAIQEQQKQIEALESKNSALLGRLNALEARVQGIEQAATNARAEK